MISFFHKYVNCFMKKLFICTAALFFTNYGYCQQTFTDSFNIKRQNITKIGVKILAGYNVVNIIYGSVAYSQNNSGNKYFHKMNAVWNSVTLGLVGIGLLTAKKEGRLTYGASLKKQSEAEKIFLFNTALDLAYVAGGAYLTERAKTNTANPLRLKGFGESIILQGAVLFLFD